MSHSRRRSYSRSPPRRRDDRRRDDRRSRRRSRSPEFNPWEAKEGDKLPGDAGSSRGRNSRRDGNSRGGRSGPKRAENPFFKKKGEEEKKTVWGKREDSESSASEKEQKNFEKSGALTKEFRIDAKTGEELKYIEPQESRIPKTKWRLYPFKGEASLDPYKVYRQAFYLFGRDRKVADIATLHPSCSKQHAVLQYRLVMTEKGKKLCRPYIMDLGSTNGTFLNGTKLDPHRYVELMEKDVIKFGNSTRDYVLLNERSM